MLISRLNDYWGDEIAKVEAKRNAHALWVKISNVPPDFSRLDTRNLLEDWGILHNQVGRDENGYKVQCQTEEDRVNLLKYHGTKIDNHRIDIQRMRLRMTPNEIFEYIAERLESVEGGRDFRRQAQMEYGRPSHMNAVEVLPAKEETKTVQVDNTAHVQSPRDAPRSPVQRDNRQRKAQVPPERSSRPPQRTDSRAPPSRDPPRRDPSPAPRGNGQQNQWQSQTYRPPHTHANEGPPRPRENQREQRAPEYSRGRDQTPRDYQRDYSRDYQRQPSRSNSAPPTRESFGQAQRDNRQPPRDNPNVRVNQTSAGRRQGRSQSPTIDVIYPFKPAAHNRNPQVNAVSQARGPRIQS